MKMQMAINDIDFRGDTESGYVRMCAPGMNGEYRQCFNKNGSAATAHCRNSFERVCRRFAKNAGVKP